MQPRRSSHPLLRGALVALAGLTALLAACEAKMPTAADVDRMDARSAEGTARSLGLVKDSAVTWFVDGLPSSAAAANRIPTDSVASVEVNKVEGRSRITLTTKAYAQVGFATTNDTVRALRRRVGARYDTLTATIGRLPAELGLTEPILLIDGKRAEFAALKTMDRARIATVNVLKGPAAVSTYGADARNGVILVQMKAAGAP